MSSAKRHAPTFVEVIRKFDLTVLPCYAEWEYEEKMLCWTTCALMEAMMEDEISERDCKKLVPRFEAAGLSLVYNLLKIDEEDISEILEGPPISMKRFQRRCFCKALDNARRGLWKAPELPGDPEALSRRRYLSVAFFAPIQPVPRGIFSKTRTGKPERSEAHLLAWFVLVNPKIFLGGKHIIEIGCGWAALSGLVTASLMAKRGDEGQVLLTDKFEGHSEENAASLLRETISATHSKLGYPVRMQKMSWEIEAERVAALRKLGGRIDHIFAVDILHYTLGQPRLPLIAAKDLMERSSAARSDVSFWCVYNTRFGRSHLDGVRSVARDLGLKLTEIKPRSFIPMRPHPPPLDKFDRGALVLLRFQMYFPN